MRRDLLEQPGDASSCVGRDGADILIRVHGPIVDVRVRRVAHQRVDDAMHATKAAVEEGIVAGGGSALLFASKALERLNVVNADQQVGIEIVRRAIEAPARQIAENAGAEGSVVVGKLREKKDENWGYDAAVGEYKDMIKAGIIDPTKVVRTALQDAASIAGLIITTEAMVATKPERPAPSAPTPSGGMDF